MSRGLTLAVHDSIRESRGGCERGSFRRRRLRWPVVAVFASLVLLSLFGPQGTLAEPGSKGIYGAVYKMTISPISTEAIGTKSLTASWRSGERERGKALPRTQPLESETSVKKKPKNRLYGPGLHRRRDPPAQRHHYLHGERWGQRRVETDMEKEQDRERGSPLREDNPLTPQLDLLPPQNPPRLLTPEHPRLRPAATDPSPSTLTG